MNKISNNRNHGTQSTLRSLKCKTECNRSKEDKIKNGISVSSTDDIESPYKSLTGFKSVYFNDSLSEENDFKEKPPPKLSKPIQVPKAKSKKRVSKKNKRPKKVNTLDKFIGGNDVNADHLQMAIALSKSTYESEYEESTDSQPIHIGTVETTLEKYGFKLQKPRIEPELKKFLPNKLSERSKKSKFAYITPTLFIRTKQDQEALIQSKMSLILSRNLLPPTAEHFETSLYSDILEKLVAIRKVFDTDSIYKNKSFFVEKLNIPREAASCGCLFKKWEDIQGRDQSPSRQKEAIISEEVSSVKISKEKDEKQIEIPNQHQYRSISPDLFDSDDETELLNLNQNYVQPRDNSVDSLTPVALDDQMSQSLLTPKKMQGSVKTFFKSVKNAIFCSEIADNESQTDKLLCSDGGSTNELSKSCNIKPSDCKDVESQELQHILSGNHQHISSPKTETNIGKTSLKTNCLDNDVFPIDLTQLASDGEIDGENEDKTTENLADNSQTSQLQIETSQTSQLHIETSELETSLKYKKSEETLRYSYGLRNLSFDYECTRILNVTDYVNNLLSSSNAEQDCASADAESVKSSKHSANSSKASQESLVVSDEELNYSSAVHDKSVAKSKNYYSLEEFEDAAEPFSADVFQSTPDGDHNSDNKSKGKLARGNSLHPSTLSSSISRKLSCRRSLSESLANYSNQEVSQSLVSDNFENNPTKWRTSPVLSQKQNYLVQENFSKTKTAAYPSSSSGHTIRNQSFQKSLSESFAKDSFQEVWLPNNVSETLEETHAKYETSPILLPKDSDLLQEHDDFYKNIGNDESVPHSRLSTSTVDSLKKSNILNKPSETFANDSLQEVLETNDIFDVYEKNNVSQVTSPILSQKQDYFQHKNSDKNMSKTPDNNLLIKTKDITPMPNYDDMNTPIVAKELQKFGLKPLKRQRGVKLLKYLYDCTHPVVRQNDSESSDESGKVVKKKKIDDAKLDEKRNLASGSVHNSQEFKIDIIGDALLKSEKEEDLIFETKQSKKIASCKIPLQIVWYNFLCCNRDIHENVLLYEPIQIEVIHAMLKEQGYKFRIQDLQTFLDRKSITIRTAPAQGGKKKRY